MDTLPLFSRRHFPGGTIVCGVREYLRSAFSYRDVEELVRECRAAFNRITMFRWVQRNAPERDKRYCSYRAGMPDSFRVNEISIKIKKKWHYLYRSVDSESQAIGSLLSATRDAQAAERFFHMPLWAHHRVPPRVITVDIHAAYPPACKALQQECRRPA